MRVIWKYKVEPKVFVRQLPEDAIFCHVAEQRDDEVSMWFDADPEAVKTERKFTVVPTGEKFDIPNRKYLGTFLLKNRLVFHLYEVFSDGT